MKDANSGLNEGNSISMAQKANSSFTSFTEEDDTAHIAAIQTLMVGRPLYQIEEHWNL